MFPRFNFPQFWSEDDGRGHYSRNYIAASNRKTPAHGQAIYADLGHLGGRCESITQVANFLPFPYRLAANGRPTRLHRDAVRGASTGWPCSRARHRRVRLAATAACTAGRHFSGRVSRPGDLPGDIEESRRLLRDLSEVTSLAEIPLARLARLPLHITEFLTSPSTAASGRVEGANAVDDLDPLDPASVSEHIVGVVSGIHCGQGLVWAKANYEASGEAIVAFAAGSSLDELIVNRLRRQDDSVGSWSLAQDGWSSRGLGVNGGEIFEVVGEDYGGLEGLLVAVRRRDRFQLFQQQKSESSYSSAISFAQVAESSSIGQVGFLSVSLNPHIAGELVAMDANLVVRLWDVNRATCDGSQLRLLPWQRHFPADQLAPWAPGETWATAVIGAHHRSLLCAGGQLAIVCDLRAPERSAPALRLLELTASGSGCPERLRSHATVGAHCHLVGSEGNLRLLDDRMTRWPVLHTRCPTHGAPSLLRLARLGEGDSPETVLFVGAQVTGDLASLSLAVNSPQLGGPYIARSAAAATPAEDHHSLPPRITSESRLLPLPGPPPDGLRGLAVVPIRSDSRGELEILVIRYTGRGGLYLQRLLPAIAGGQKNASTDVVVVKQPSSRRKRRRIPAIKKNHDIQDKDSNAKGESSFSLDLPMCPEPPPSLEMRPRGPLRVPDDNEVSALPYRTLSEFASPEDQAALDPASLVLARLWHRQDASVAARQRQAAALEVRETVEHVAAEELDDGAAGADEAEHGILDETLGTNIEQD